MVRPARFGFNDQTAGSNAFQQNKVSSDVHALAMAEFDKVLKTLRAAGIEVVVMDSSDPDTPDAIFPNNWFSTHEEGCLVVYPMMAPNRRREYSSKIVETVMKFGQLDRMIDLRDNVSDEHFLEGTGSIVFDHDARVAYAAVSPRTSADVLNALCERIGYQSFLFHCMDAKGEPVYHTNVVMCMGAGTAIVFLEGIAEKVALAKTLQDSGRLLVEITRAQMESFCGNMLLLRDREDNLKMILSDTAMNALREDQQRVIFGKAEPVVVSIPVIERVGGGGIRCMLAELFIQNKQNGQR